ncbi:hypothetical protein L596_009659 [Steinernema carpocapsae]|uniref:Uncharacterized protein n=1 Tax=Steinernema carpocapsae TaxID=34508 RepID=A0A4U5PHA6_STECR|nr:hypothetical protein L596_009659 [Steinernema carpocapsae]
MSGRAMPSPDTGVSAPPASPGRVRFIARARAERLLAIKVFQPFKCPSCPHIADRFPATSGVIFIGIVAKAHTLSPFPTLDVSVQTLGLQIQTYADPDESGMIADYSARPLRIGAVGNVDEFEQCVFLLSSRNSPSI